MLAFAAMIISLAAGPGQVRAEFTPPPFDPEARAGMPAVPEELGWSELDVQVFKVSVCGVVRPVGGSMGIGLTNPAGNHVWLKLRVLDADGNLLGETGLIRPGEYLRSVSLDSVPPSGTAIVLKIMAYEPDIYHSAGAVSLKAAVS